MLSVLWLRASQVLREFHDDVRQYFYVWYIEQMLSACSKFSDHGQGWFQVNFSIEYTVHVICVLIQDDLIALLPFPRPQ